MAEGGSIQAGVQIILLNAYGRFFGVDHSQMKEGTDHFAEVAATAFFGIDLYSH
jgi:hypothetical protein